MIDYHFNAYGGKYPHNRDRDFKNNISISKGEIKLNDLVLREEILNFHQKV